MSVGDRRRSSRAGARRSPKSCLDGRERRLPPKITSGIVTLMDETDVPPEWPERYALVDLPSHAEAAG